MNALNRHLVQHDEGNINLFQTVDLRLGETQKELETRSKNLAEELEREECGYFEVWTSEQVRESSSIRDLSYP